MAGRFWWSKRVRGSSSEVQEDDGVTKTRAEMSRRRELTLALVVHLVPLAFGSVIWIGAALERTGSFIAVTMVGSLAAFVVGLAAGERFWGGLYAMPGASLLLAVTIGQFVEAVGWIGLYVAIGTFWILWTPSLLIGLVVVVARYFRERAGVDV